MDNCQKQWIQWLADFRQRLIEANKWSEKEAKLRIRDGWAVVRNGWVHVLTNNDQRPADAVPVFQMLTVGGRKLPIEIVDRLTGVIGKAMRSQRPPRDIVMGLLDLANHADGQDESDEIKRKRNKAAFWSWQLRDACEDEALTGVIENDVFWQVPLSAYQAGYCYAILDLYRDPQLLADLVKAQAFQSGRGPDEVSRRLEESYLARRAVLGRDASTRDVAKAAGGVWSEIDSCWTLTDCHRSHTEASASASRISAANTPSGNFSKYRGALLRKEPLCAWQDWRKCRVNHLSSPNLPSCPSTYSAAHLITLNVAPLWLRPNVAVKMSSLPNYEVERLIKEKLIKVAWRRNKAGKLYPLIYALSLWSYIERLPQTGPAEEGAT